MATGEKEAKMQAVKAEAVTTSESPPTASPTPGTAAKLPKRAIVWTAILSVTITALTLIVIDRLRASREAEVTQVAAGPEAPGLTDPGLVQVANNQLQSIKLEPAMVRSFRAEKIATGKIGFNEDLMTPVFSPYAGRVLKLLAKPGDAIGRGAPLFEIDTPDLVGAEQELIAAGIAVPTAKTALELATRAEDR